MDEDYFHWCLLRLGKAELMLNTAYEFNEERPPKPERERTTFHWDVGLYLSCPDVNAAYEQLRARGVNVDQPFVTGYGMKQLYLRDPDGYQLCFQWQA